MGSSKNKDLLKTISEKFIKTKPQEETTSSEVEKKSSNEETSTSNKHLALDLLKVGRDYLAIEIEYDLTDMTARVLSSSPFDNRVAGLTFHHGRIGIESMINRSKRHNKES